MAKRKSFEEKNKHIHKSRQLVIDTVFGRTDDNQTTFGYEKEADKKREVGEKWVDSEGVEYDPYLLGTYVVATQPDMRKTINNLQANSMDNKLSAVDEDSQDDSAWLIKMVDLFKSGNIREARKLIIANARPDEYESIYRKMYENLDWFGDTPDQQDNAVIAIRNGLVKHLSVADVEINLSATLIELQMI